MEKNILNELNENQEQIKSLKDYRNILILTSLLLLITSIWLYFKQNNEKIPEIDPEFTLVRKDSLRSYKHYYFSKNLGNDVNLNNEKIVYYVQLGAFKEFKLSADKLMGINQFKGIDGLNKITVGTFVKYENAKNLQHKLIRLGFKDCFLITRSFGNKINDIVVALNLSDEPQFIQTSDGEELN